MSCQVTLTSGTHQANLPMPSSMSVMWLVLNRKESFSCYVDSSELPILLSILGLLVYTVRLNPTAQASPKELTVVTKTRGPGNKGLLSLRSGQISCSQNCDSRNVNRRSP